MYERPTMSRRLLDQDVTERPEEKFPSRRSEYFPSGSYQAQISLSALLYSSRHRGIMNIPIVCRPSTYDAPHSPSRYENNQACSDPRIQRWGGRKPFLTYSRNRGLVAILVENRGRIYARLICRGRCRRCRRGGSPMMWRRCVRWGSRGL